jgi:hypothetical protein
MKKTLTVGVLVVIGTLLATAALAADERVTSTRPPKNLKLVGDHWTPWDPPPAGAGDHIIQRGDTLWDLAGSWLGNPYLWPQVWEQNRYVLDSHWIYPGDPLVKPGQPTVVPPEGPPAGEEQPSDAARVFPATPPPTAPPAPAPARLVPLADNSDLYCSGYIDPRHEPSQVRIAGKEMERAHLADGDVVYLSQGRNQGMAAGMRLSVRRPAQTIVHPVTDQDLGALVRRLGRLRILAVQDDTSTAVVEMSCEDMVVSDEVVPLEDLPAPMMRSFPKLDRYDVTPSGGEQGYVVAARDALVATGDGHVIYVDLGAGTGMRPGVILTLYRENADLPRLMLGRAVVLTVEDGTSTAKIVQAVREVRLGDRVEVLR